MLKNINTLLNPIPMRFIGRDGSMGLTKNEIYNCYIHSECGYIYVSWTDGCKSCPYSSIKALDQNWEVVRR